MKSMSAAMDSITKIAQTFGAGNAARLRQEQEEQQHKQSEKVDHQSENSGSQSFQAIPYMESCCMLSDLDFIDLGGSMLVENPSMATLSSLASQDNIFSAMHAIYHTPSRHTSARECSAGIDSSDAESLPDTPLVMEEVIYRACLWIEGDLRLVTVLHIHESHHMHSSHSPAQCLHRLLASSGSDPDAYRGIRVDVIDAHTATRHPPLLLSHQDVIDLVKLFEVDTSDESAGVSFSSVVCQNLRHIEKTDDGEPERWVVMPPSIPPEE